MSEALLNLIKQDNEQFELLSYDGHIVKFYYNSKYNKPLVGLQLQKAKLTKYVAQRIAAKMCVEGFASTTTRIIIKHCAALYACEKYRVLQLVMLSLSERDSAELGVEKCKLIEENGLVDILLRYYIFLQGKQIGERVTQIIILFLTQLLIHQRSVCQNEQLLELLRNFVDSEFGEASTKAAESSESRVVDLAKLISAFIDAVDRKNISDA